eukprot:TRINITY_DN4287_c0_g2_i1.p1 TRINITY_DN4287_c0_g2~~TRINITY_DN4287_c0_g2_i1.p1  ORF type:complete len:344 (+),score=37.02 TRINITY_DN4287_c0_g2_i1:56-1087(+)
MAYNVQKADGDYKVQEWSWEKVYEKVKERVNPEVAEFLRKRRINGFQFRELLEYNFMFENTIFLDRKEIDNLAKIIPTESEMQYRYNSQVLLALNPTETVYRHAKDHDWHVVIEFRKGKKAYQIDLQSSIMFGRDTNQITLMDESVEEKHAVLAGYQVQGLCIRDLGSAHGTYIESNEVGFVKDLIFELGKLQYEIKEMDFLKDTITLKIVYSLFEDQSLVGTVFTLRSIDKVLYLGYDPDVTEPNYFSLPDPSLSKLVVVLSFTELAFMLVKGTTHRMWHRVSHAGKESDTIAFRSFGSDHLGDGARVVRFGYRETTIVRATPINFREDDEEYNPNRYDDYY